MNELRPTDEEIELESRQRAEELNLSSSANHAWVCGAQWARSIATMTPRAAGTECEHCGEMFSEAHLCHEKGCEVIAPSQARKTELDETRISPRDFCNNCWSRAKRLIDHSAQLREALSLTIAEHQKDDQHRIREITELRAKLDAEKPDRRVYALLMEECLKLQDWSDRSVLHVAEHIGNLFFNQKADNAVIRAELESAGRAIVAAQHETDRIHKEADVLIHDLEVKLADVTAKAAAAGRCCLDIYTDYDESEVPPLTASVRMAWEQGKAISAATGKSVDGHYTAHCHSCGKDTAYRDDRDGEIECVHCGHEIAIDDSDAQ